MNEWLAIVSRHFTTVLVVVAVMWTVAKPHAEEFIRTTVNERITRVEIQLEQQNKLLMDMSHRLEAIDNRTKRR